MLRLELQLGIPNPLQQQSTDSTAEYNGQSPSQEPLPVDPHRDGRLQRLFRLENRHRAVVEADLFDHSRFRAAQPDVPATDGDPVERLENPLQIDDSPDWANRRGLFPIFPLRRQHVFILDHFGLAFDRWTQISSGLRAVHWEDID